MDGIILINKPIGCTSRDIVNQVMKKFNTRKVGHTGTLDPFATGLMIVTINKGTKISGYLEILDKEYIAELKLGEKTTTLDLEGDVIEKKEVSLPLDKSKVLEVMNSFIGEIDQIPPMYSAIKVNGEELYKLARRGEEIKRASRRVRINSLELLSITRDRIIFSTSCSKGTYIRTLGEDIASKLGYPGHLTMLNRTRIGKYDLKAAKEVNELTEKDIIPITKALSHLATLTVDGKDEFKVRNGVKLHLSGNSLYFIKNKNDEPLAIYEKKDDGFYHCLRGLW